MYANIFVVKDINYKRIYSASVLSAALAGEENFAGLNELDLFSMEGNRFHAIIIVVIFVAEGEHAFAVP